MGNKKGCFERREALGLCTEDADIQGCFHNDEFSNSEQQILVWAFMRKKKEIRESYRLRKEKAQAYKSDYT